MLAALRDLVPFGAKPAILLKVTLRNACFSRF